MPLRILLLIENSRAYGRGLMRGIARYTRIHRPWDFIIKPDFYSRPPVSETLEDFKGFLNQLDIKKIDGMIIRELPSPFMKFLAKMDVPSIIIPYLNEFPENFTNKIITDSKAISEMVAKYFIEKGFRNFAYSGYDSMFWSEKRKKNFKNFLNKNGFDLFLHSNPEQIKNYQWQKDKESLAKWLSQVPKPIGLLACTDDRALQVLEACRYANIKVPEEVSIVGVDNDDLICDLSSVGISSVDLTTEQAGYESAARLESIIHGEAVQEFTIKVLPKRVITRQSSDILAIEDNAVAKAIKFIRENFRKNIRVGDVINATTCSRRVLEKKFTKNLGKTIAQEIRRFRVDKITELLTETDLPIKQIAAMSGFESTKHISRYFSREKKMGPQQYRKIHL